MRHAPGVRIMKLASLPSPMSSADARVATDITADGDSAFFALWLDRSLSFSAAMFQEGDDLHTAQIRKLDYLLAAAQCRDARRVLDIGCGWGSALERMVTHFNVQRPVGLAANAAQARWATTHRPARIQIRCENWNDHETVVPYDAVLSIDAFRYFCRPGLLRDERIRAYRRFFAKCRRMLKPQGRLVLESIVKGNRQADKQAFDDTRFVQAEIFEGSDFPCVAEIIESTFGLFDVVRLRNDADHYARTFELWAHALETQRAAALATAGPERVARYERHLRGSQRLFERGYAGLARIALRAI